MSHVITNGKIFFIFSKNADCRNAISRLFGDLSKMLLIKTTLQKLKPIDNTTPQYSFQAF